MAEEIYAKTQTYRAEQIAKRLGIPKNMAERVMIEYIKSLKEDLINGERVVINGLVTLTPTLSQKAVTGPVVTVRARTSPIIKEKLESSEYYSIKTRNHQTLDNLYTV